MKLLLLGGTRFVGRHLVDAALARGHDVTTFTRGRVGSPWPGRVRALVGDRDPDVPPGLSALASGEWDALIDLSGYVPRCVGASARLLADRVGQALFVSSISVYADASAPGVDETAPVAALADPATEDVMANYGALKAACEREVAAAFGAARSTHVRPGLIVGPWDATDRFGYWVARYVVPKLLGARGEAIVAPAPPERALQVVDARDLCAFMLDLVERRTAGVFNAVSPAGQRTFGDLVVALTAAARRRGRRVRTVWVDDAALVAAGVVPWTGLPLWIPASETAEAGFMAIDARRAAAAGLATRPLAATIDATAAWLATRPNAEAWRNVLAANAERALAAAGR